MTPRPGAGRARSPLAWLSVVLLAYLALPLAYFLARSTTHPSEGTAVPGLSTAVATSAEAATISLCLLAFFGVPLAYWLAHSTGPVAAVAGTVVQLPLALPPLMSGVVLLYVFGPNTFLGKLSGGRLTESVAGIVLAQSFVASPFLVIAARSAFERVPGQLEDVAATVGWGAWGRFWRVALPVAGPGVRAGLLLAWLRAFGEYGATVMMAYYPQSLPVFTYVQFSAVGLSATQAPTLISLALATVVVALGRLRLPRRPLPAHLVATVKTGAGAPSGQRLPAGPSGLLTASATRRDPEPVAFELSTGAGGFKLELAYSARTPRLALVGPSGAGKSMTLRCLAGLLPGQVNMGGRSVGHLPPERRQVGYVPQGDSLMPHLRVWDNVTFGPFAQAAEAANWLAALGIADLADRWPAQLSGGQRQRTALARALSCQARVLLLDEPFSGLDAPQRAALVRELRRLQLESSLSSVLVTHDITEAALLADEVVVLCGGRAAQCGPLPEVLARPASAEVAGVLGLRNLLPGRATAPSSLRAGAGEMGPELATDRHGLVPGAALVWSVSPRAIQVRATAGAGSHQARVLDAADLGQYVLCRLGLDGGVELEAEVTSGHWPVGSPCWASIDPGTVLVWPAGGQGT